MGRIKQIVNSEEILKPWGDARTFNPKLCSKNGYEAVQDVLNAPAKKFKNRRKMFRIITSRHPHGGIDLLPVLTIVKDEVGFYCLLIGVLGKTLVITWR